MRRQNIWNGSNVLKATAAATSGPGAPEELRHKCANGDRSGWDVTITAEPRCVSAPLTSGPRATPTSTQQVYFRDTSSAWTTEICREVENLQTGGIKLVFRGAFKWAVFTVFTRKLHSNNQLLCFPWLFSWTFSECFVSRVFGNVSLLEVNYLCAWGTYNLIVEPAA